MTRPIPPRWLLRAEVVLLAAGVVLRLVRFLDRRPLWVDEAMLALNILHRPLHGFFRPLEDNQVSPLGFLWLEWLASRLLGSAEWALRLIPFLAAVAGLIVFARLARRMLEPGAALLATALAALSPLLIDYGAEVKSYSMDWLAAVLLMHATLTVVDAAYQRPALFRWSLVALFAALVSTPAPLVIAACGLALLCTPEIRREPRAWLRVIAAALPAVVVVAIHMVSTYDSPRVLAFMQSFWANQFLPTALPDLYLRAVSLVRGFLETALFGLILNDLPGKTVTAVVLLSGLGIVGLFRRSVSRVITLWGPVVFAAGAAVLERWPLTPRLLLFALPAVLLSLAAGLELLTRWLPARARGPALATVGLLLAGTVGWAAVRSLRYTDPRFLPVGEALRALAVDPDSGTTIYVSGDLVAACRYYTSLHPDRLGPAADTTAASECKVPGARTLLGPWPRYAKPTPEGRDRIDTEWLDQEARKILDASNGRVWLVLGASELYPEFGGRLARSGARLTAERSALGLRMQEYQRGRP